MVLCIAVYSTVSFHRITPSFSQRSFRPYLRESSGAFPTDVGVYAKNCAVYRDRKIWKDVLTLVVGCVECGFTRTVWLELVRFLWEAFRVEFFHCAVYCFLFKIFIGRLCLLEGYI